jgi:hypothetical protein
MSFEKPVTSSYMLMMLSVMLRSWCIKSILWGQYQCIYIRELSKTTFMSLVILFIVTFEPAIFRLLTVIEHFRDINSKLSLWWSFSNGLAFQKRLFVTPEWVTYGKESSITIKESDFPTVLKSECIRVIYTYWTIESIVDTLAGKFAIY